MKTVRLLLYRDILWSVVFVALAFLSLFFFIGVPLLGAVLTGMLGRKLGSLATAVGAGGVAWVVSTSALLAAAAGVAALVLVGLLGIGAAGGVAAVLIVLAANQPRHGVRAIAGDHITPEKFPVVQRDGIHADVECHANHGHNARGIGVIQVEIHLLPVGQIQCPLLEQ